MAVSAETAKGTVASAPEEEGTASGALPVGQASSDLDHGLDDSTSAQDARRRRRMSTVGAATLVGLVMAALLVSLAGWLGFRTYEAQRAQKQQAAFLQVGRQAALNLTTIDWHHADEDVRRILDSTTGTFHNDFEKRAPVLVDAVRQAQSTSAGTIADAGLESESENAAQVLVAVSVKTSLAGVAMAEPRRWRMRVSVEKSGDLTKVSNVEFVP